MTPPQWLQWAKQLQAITQNGLTFNQDPYDVERYEAVRQVASEMMAAGSNARVSQILDLFSNEAGYATPKVDVRGAVFRNNEILLVKERIDGGWTLPGGWADVCDSPGEAVAREIFEESGFETEVTKLVAVYDRSKHPHQPPFPHHVYKMFFLCQIVNGKATNSHETEDVAFFKEDAIPPLSISRVLPAQIARMFEYYRNPALPTDFD